MDLVRQQEQEQIKRMGFFNLTNEDDVNSLDLDKILTSACHFIEDGTTHHKIGTIRMAKFLKSNKIHSLTVEELVKGTLFRVSFFIGGNKYDVNFRFKLFRSKTALEEFLGQVVAETLLIHKNYAEQVSKEIEDKITNSYRKQYIHDFQKQNKEIIERVCSMITHKFYRSLLFPRPFRDDASDITEFNDITQEIISDCHNKVGNLACDLVNALQSNSENRFYFDVNSILEVLTQKEVDEKGKEVFKYSSFDIGSLIVSINDYGLEVVQIGSIIETIIAFYSKCYEDCLCLNECGFDRFKIFAFSQISAFLQDSFDAFEAKFKNNITKMRRQFEKHNAVDYHEDSDEDSSWNTVFIGF